jgi:hypothetical protein
MVKVQIGIVWGPPTQIDPNTGHRVAADPFPRFHGFALDGNLDRHFWTTQLDKLKFYGGFNIWDELVDLPAGTTLKIVYGNTAQPTLPWHAVIAVNDQIIAEGDVHKDQFLEAPGITITETTMEPVKLQFIKTKQCAVDYEQLLLAGQTAMYYTNNTIGSISLTNCNVWNRQFCYIGNLPYAVDWEDGRTSLSRGEFLRGRLYIRPTGTRNGSRNKLWISINGGKPRIIPSYISRDDRWYAWPKSLPVLGYTAMEYLTEPIYLNQNLAGGSVHIEGGHIDEYTGQYVVDDSLDLTLTYAKNCLPPGPPWGRTQLHSTTIYPDVPYDITRRGRMLLCYFMIDIIENPVIPFVRILDPDGNILKEEIESYVQEAGFSHTFIVYLYVNEAVEREKYFILQYGHLEEGVGTDPIIPPRQVVDGQTTIDLTVPFYGVTENITFQAVTVQAPPAQINNVAFQAIWPKAIINSVKFQAIQAPPPPPSPPPPTTFSLGGKVLSLLGPVADAEVTLNGFSTKTGRDGSFYITNIPEGTYTLTVKPTRIHERLLLKSVTQKIDIYMDTSKIINLPLNWTNLGIGAASTAAIGAVLSARKKPKPPTW